MNNITVPTLLLDEQKCRANIRFMAEKAAASSVSFRPHFKTHQSAAIGEWFREAGVNKITVSSFRMAEYFAEAGWTDILVAFPVNILEWERINLLSGKIRLSILAEEEEGISFLSQKIQNELNVYIKIDAGYHRSGIYFNDHKSISRVIGSIKQTANMTFAGFLTHAGNSYKARGKDEVLRVHNESTSRMASLAEKYRTGNPQLIVSVGDTPSCSLAGNFRMVDEIRPGNFVFYDYTQVVIGSCKAENVAVAMACPVVSVHPGRNELVIYGGSIHFAKDSVVNRDGRVVHGAVVNSDGMLWNGITEGAWLTKLSQEHGIVELPDNLVNAYKPGDIITIIPAHSCTTANLMKEYLTSDGTMISCFTF